MKHESQITPEDFQAYSTSLGLWCEFTRDDVVMRAEISAEELMASDDPDATIKEALGAALPCLNKVHAHA